MTDKAIVYNDDLRGCTRCYATLCIYHDDMPPDEISYLLDCTPDRIVLKGEKLLLGRAEASANGWFIGSDGEFDSSKDIARHIDFLAHIIRYQFDELQNLKQQGARIVISCFWGSAYGNGGPFVDSRVIELLHKMGASLEFDVWMEEEVNPS